MAVRYRFGLSRGGELSGGHTVVGTKLGGIGLEPCSLGDWAPPMLLSDSSTMGLSIPERLESRRPTKLDTGSCLRLWDEAHECASPPCIALLFFHLKFLRIRLGNPRSMDSS